MKPTEISKLMEKCVIASAWVQPTSQVTSTPQLHKMVNENTPFGFMNGIYRTQLSEVEATQVIPQEHKAFKEKKISYRWYSYPHSTPNDLEQRLQKLSPSKITRMAGLFYSLENYQYQPAQDVTVEEVSEENLEEYAQCNCDGWSQTGKEAEDIKNSIRSDFAKKDKGYRAFLARYKGEPASTGMFRVVDKAGYLLGGSTNPKFRNKGVYSGLVHYRLKILSEMELPLALVLARKDSSAPVLIKLGFEVGCDINSFDFDN